MGHKFALRKRNTIIAESSFLSKSALQKAAIEAEKRIKRERRVSFMPNISN